MSFTDIHTHVLPEVDDGSSSLEETVEMLRIAYEHGTRLLVATPHMFFPTVGSLTARDLRAFFTQTVAALEHLSERPKFGFLRELELALGAESHISGDLIEALADRAVLPLGESCCLLVDCSSSLSFDTLIAAIAKIQDSGYVPVLAHVERYSPFRRNLERLREVRRRGCLCQVNAGSLVQPGSRLRGFCKQILSAGLVDAVASDTHDPAKRHPRLSDVHAYLTKAFGADKSAGWLSDNPRSILGIDSPQARPAFGSLGSP